MANSSRKYFVFRVDEKSIGKLWEELKEGRLRQGWGIPGTELIDKHGNVINKSTWIANYIQSALTIWGEQIPYEKAEERYRILSLMLEMKSGDVIIIPKMPEPQTFTITIVESGYSFEILQGFDDFGHIVSVDKKYIKTFDDNANLDTYIISSRLSSYRKAVNNIKNIPIINAIDRLLEKMLFSRTLDPIVYESADKILKMVDFKEILDSSIYRGEEGIKFSPQIKEIISEMEPSREVVMENEKGLEILGYYVPMQSPGKIVLKWDKIGSFFWHTILELVDYDGYNIRYSELENIAILFVLKTYIHEQFHFICDVCCQLFSKSFDRNVEEALAVAWSFLKLNEMKKQGNNEISAISSSLFNEIMRKIFAYTAPGYRDWINYQSEIFFERGIVSYLGPASSNYLMSNGINVGKIIMQLSEPLLNENTVSKSLLP